MVFNSLTCRSVHKQTGRHLESRMGLRVVTLLEPSIPTGQEFFLRMFAERIKSTIWDFPRYFPHA